jgi:hypothetical protein
MKVPEYVPRNRRRKRGEVDPRGRGRILCHICGSPVRDHQIGPCPWGDTDGELVLKSVRQESEVSR